MRNKKMSDTQNKTITVEKRVFDIDAKDEVLLRKSGEFVPVSTMQEFTERLGNNAQLILELANKALEVHAETELAGDESKKWMLVEDGEDGAETLTEFTGTALSPEKSKSLQATVINFAKLLFGYSKNMVPGDVVKNREAKKAAKDSALAAILSNPAAVEGLKK